MFIVLHVNNVLKCDYCLCDKRSYKCSNNTNSVIMNGYQCFTVRFNVDVHLATVQYSKSGSVDCVYNFSVAYNFTQSYTHLSESKYVH